MDGRVTGLLFSFLGFILRCIQSLVHWTLKLIKGSKTGVVPAVSNTLLLEPAVVLAAKIRTGKVKSETVVKAYIERINSVNPVLNAVVEDRFQEALKEAKAADKYIETSGRSPDDIAFEKPFLGVPFTAKVSVAIKDLDLSSGVIARKGIKADEDCTVVVNLRSAGAIPLCVTNVPQFCMACDASNNLFGVTKNAYDLTRVPGGSSGGEGALISSAASIFGIGNDLGGSIRMPSFFSGIFGHKPTRKVLSNKGQFPSSYDTEVDNYNVTGPMCRYSIDLIPMLKALAGREAAAKMQLDDQVDLKSLKVYYTEDYDRYPFRSKVEPEIRQSVRKVVKHLETTFGIKAKEVKVPLLSSAWPIWISKFVSAKGTVPITDFATKEPGTFNLYKELAKCLFGLSEHTFLFLIFLIIDSWYRSSFMKRQRDQNIKKFDDLAANFQDLLKNDGIFIFPTSPTTAPFHEELLFQMYNFSYTGIFNVLGLPVTQCPTGMSSDGLPLGVQVISNLMNDRFTLAVAREIEQQFGGWRSPSPIL